MSSLVALIDYGSGNVRSAANALRTAATQSSQDVTVELTRDLDRIGQADRIVLPGVGSFAGCKAGLDAVDGLEEALTEAVLRKARPFLGICVGMQLLAEVGLEHGRHSGLGWIEGEVSALTPHDDTLKIPHMGWNQVAPTGDHPVLNAPEKGGRFGEGQSGGPPGPAWMYFVHSYAFRPRNESDVVAWCDYAGAFPAAVARDTILGVQFHPEKSQTTGLMLLSAFLGWRP